MREQDCPGREIGYVVGAGVGSVLCTVGYLAVSLASTVSYKLWQPKMTLDVVKCPLGRSGLHLAETTAFNFFLEKDPRMRLTELKAMSLFIGLCAKELPSNSLCHKCQENGIREPHGSSGGACKRVVLMCGANNGFPLLLTHLQGVPFTLQFLGRAAQSTSPDIAHLEYDMITAASNLWVSL